jgi:hypothetical protein
MSQFSERRVGSGGDDRGPPGRALEAAGKPVFAIDWPKAKAGTAQRVLPTSRGSEALERRMPIPFERRGGLRSTVAKPIRPCRQRNADYEMLFYLKKLRW